MIQYRSRYDLGLSNLNLYLKGKKQAGKKRKGKRKGKRKKRKRELTLNQKCFKENPCDMSNKK